MDWKGIAITDGIGQQDRQPPALDPGYFNVDELSFEDLLALGSEIASGISVYNLENEIDGDWAPMFEADEAVIMAKILSTDLVRIQSDYLEISAYRPDELCQFILGLAARIDLWFRRSSASRHESGNLLARKIATTIADKLAGELHNLCRIASRTDTKTDTEGFYEFDAIWGLGDPQGDDPFPESSAGDLQNVDEIQRHLNESFYTFSNAISFLKTTAALLIQQSLESGQHDPAIGLFMVFLKLYQKAQHQLNGFTPRHLDFYYDRILKTSSRGRIPECYYLLCEPRTGSGKIRVEKDTGFSAGKDAELNEIVYHADEDLLVSDTRLESLATLHFQRDRLISPEAELGFVTRIKSGWPELTTASADADLVQAQPVAWSLFGTEQPGRDKGISNDARIGFSVASALLLLEQGARNIELNIELAAVEALEVDNQVARLLNSDSPQAFERHFGGLFARYLLTFKGCLSAQQVSDILTLAEALLSNHLAQEIRALLSQDWQDLFYKLFRNLFRVKLTTENGWLDVPDYVVLPCSQERSDLKTGLRLLLSLGQDVEPITPYKAKLHGGVLETELPVLQCRINPQSSFCAYSVFQNLVIASLTIDVEVSGVKNLVAYNQHGQLDPSKPFQPFGPLPGSNSYLIFGNYELARKQLMALKIDLDWAELPRNMGGFEEYYRGYETDYDNGAFKGEFSVLSDSRWAPDDPVARTRFNLFETEAAGGRIASKKVVKIDNLDDAPPIDVNVAEADFKYDLKARKGFYRLLLSAPESAFGHAEFPALLSTTLSANARRKKPLPVPNSPYTPTLNGISLGYKARTTIIPLLQGKSGNDSDGQIFHLHPFGVETVFPTKMDRPCFLLPQYEHEGNLFIGLSGSDIAGPMSLLFHLSQDVALATLAESEVLDWFYLAANHWKKLPAKNLLSDTTHGFLATGKITLDIPADIERGNTVMPGDYFWLRVSVRRAANAFSGCFSIQPHALKVSHRSGVKLDSAQNHGEAIKWTSLYPIAGVRSIKQAYKAFGGRAEESKNKRKVRIAERLRHKNRALTPRDYEQLVLERFPEIYKVKCFSSISSKHDAINPGHVLIVVVPEELANTGGTCSCALINTRQLEQIKTYVKNLCPMFVQIEVRNPIYEKVQVRCTVKFVDEISAGVNINRLNQQISDYICPWEAPGYKARFGWSIRQRDIESYIRSLDYIEFVTNFSMLHITVDSDGNYSLFDTVQDEQNREAAIRPRYPWSLAIPAEKHFIETTLVAQSVSAEITGVGELAVGSTLIISGSSEYGEEE
jgi:hypothetical protein